MVTKPFKEESEFSCFAVEYLGEIDTEFEHIYHVYQPRWVTIMKK